MNMIANVQNFSLKDLRENPYAGMLHRLGVPCEEPMVRSFNSSLPPA